MTLNCLIFTCGLNLTLFPYNLAISPHETPFDRLTCLVKIPLFGNNTENFEVVFYYIIRLSPAMFFPGAIYKCCVMQEMS